MLRRLAGCNAALLAYCPRAYAERSSGILWAYASSRRAVGLPAAVVGLGGGWLERESRELGLAWRSAVNPSSSGWLKPLAEAIDAGQGRIQHCLEESAARCENYSDIILGKSFAEQIASRLNLAYLPK